MEKLRKYGLPLLLCASAVLLRQTLRPFAAAFALAWLLDLPAQRLETRLARIRRLRFRRAAAVTAVLLILFSILFLFTALLLPQIEENAARFLRRLPEYRAAIAALPESTVLPPFLRSWLETQSTLLQERLSADFSLWSAGLWRTTQKVGGAVASSLSDSFIASVCCLYLLYGKHSILRDCRALLLRTSGNARYERLRALAVTAHRVFSRYAAGRVLESLLLTVLALPGLLLARIPYAPLLAPILGMGNLIPFLGPMAGTAAGFLMLVIIDPVRALWFLLFSALLQILDNQILAPRIAGGSVGLTSVQAVFAVLLGGRMFGTPGALLAVPCAGLLLQLLRSHQRREND